ncbi:hypothetical protein RvY_14516 [Ramazzottius varieornatus]|uniref:Uncharacterized protein n=1 Tax=Ramazzottius varieornatus TaxID=947166 RepID=A0A1D1VYX3_RAMVA|nr:hypothetical protein RvY_14516 [Ramazzottius varieornatus]
MELCKLNSTLQGLHPPVIQVHNGYDKISMARNALQNSGFLHARHEFINSNNPREQTEQLYARNECGKSCLSARISSSQFSNADGALSSLSSSWYHTSQRGLARIPLV